MIDEPPRGTDALDMSRSEVRRRALAGVLYVSSSAMSTLVIGFLSNLVLARLLTPEDFGVVAIGSTVALLAGIVVDGGLGAGMLRRASPPTIGELRTLNGIQLVIALAVWLPIVFAAPSFGRTGAVTALMGVALPIGVLGTPGRLVLMREMKYDRLVVVDVGAAMTGNVFSVGAVLLGAGVWGLAGGSVVRVSVMTLLTGLLASVGFVRPSLRGWRQFGELMRFGVKFQASGLAVVGREQGLTAVIALVAGVATLGQWALANKIFQLPLLAFTSLHTVGFPAMSNLLARGEDPGEIILRTARRASVVGTAVLATFAASSPALVPALFGSQWREAGQVLPLISLASLILLPISVAAGTYLAAAGKPGLVASAATAFGVIWLSVTAVLLTSLGIVAVGVGCLVAAIAEAAILVRAIQRIVGVGPHRAVLRPLLVGVGAGAAGWGLCITHSSSLFVGVASGLLAFGLTVLGLRLLCRADLDDLARLAVHAARAALPARAKPSVAKA